MHIKIVIVPPIAFLMIIILSGCAKDPKACFTQTTVSETEFRFDANCSENAVNYVWDFGDNQTSTIATPTHTYIVNKPFTVTLQVENKKGKSNSTSQETDNIEPKCMKCTCKIFHSTQTFELDTCGNPTEVDKVYQKFKLDCEPVGDLVCP